ncbi:180_t:CDS:2 [Scutellospora calospora]|uniref:180_t:CDS:1 n=1 Tax=Scutellospora calospora TaxID=85575 RepID=A0ACA9MHN7_9GLOM|nr:180_t:CDS:2 [Scutellospora calospora]
MTNTIIPKERSAYNISEAKKSIVGLCYTIEAVDTMSILGYSVCAKTVEAYRKKIKNEYSAKIEKYFLENNNLFHVFNIDDYYAIHENRRPDTVSTSTANHFATCVAKLILGYESIPIIFNGVSIYNLVNVEASRICWYLLNRYTGKFDISYLDRQLCRNSQGLVYNNFDSIEILMVHSYADNIEANKEE